MSYLFSCENGLERQSLECGPNLPRPRISCNFILSIFSKAKIVKFQSPKHSTRNSCILLLLFFLSLHSSGLTCIEVGVLEGKWQSEEDTRLRVSRVSPERIHHSLPRNAFAPYFESSSPP